MSIDLEWAKLDSSLAKYLVEVLNRQLSNAERPSFIGPVEVTSLDFGSTSPDVELVDLRDIYRDFLEDDEDDFDRGPLKVTKGAADEDDDDGFEWVSRKAAGREEGLAYQQLPPHMRYGMRSSPTDMFSSMPQLRTPLPGSADLWNSPGLQRPRSADFRFPRSPMFHSPSPSTPFPPGSVHGHPSDNPSSSLSDDPRQQFARLSHSQQQQQQQQQQAQQQQAQQNPHPNLQLHLHIDWHSDLRITITTSLLINYPSPMFMSLPIKLSVTGLVFNGEVAVAYEGERRRVHLCILDDLDPYGPAGDRPKREPAVSVTPPELDDDSPPGSVPSRPPKPLPVGQRLLPSIFIESEIGQADKHVLKNVTRVERFIQDVIRKTVEEELVFPNFHTLVMGEQ